MMFCCSFFSRRRAIHRLVSRICFSNSHVSDLISCPVSRLFNSPDPDFQPSFPLRPSFGLWSFQSKKRWSRRKRNCGDRIKQRVVYDQVLVLVLVVEVNTNYKVVRCLSLNSLNSERSSILLQYFMKSGQVLSPKQVSAMEHVLPLWITSWDSKSADSFHSRICLGVRISSLKPLEIVYWTDEEVCKSLVTMIDGSRHPENVIARNPCPFEPSNLPQVDQSVKRMLKLIKEDGDTFTRNVVYQEKKPELLSHFEQFCGKFQTLADRYHQWATCL